MAAPPSVLGSDPPVPDSACAQESTFKSIEGTTKATLTVINNTDETVQLFWLDYKGVRVFYHRVGPHSTFPQATWLTHPWIVAGAQGACYRLAVMTSLQQTITLNPGSGGGVNPVVTFPAPIETFPQTATATTATILPVAGTGSTGTGYGGIPILPVVGGFIALAAGVGVLAATGRLSGGGRRSGPVKRPPPAPGAAAALAVGEHGTERSLSDVLRESSDPMLDAMQATGPMVGKIVGDLPPFVGPIDDPQFETADLQGAVDAFQDAGPSADDGAAGAIERGESATSPWHGVVTAAAKPVPGIGAAIRTSIPGATAAEAMNHGQDFSNPDITDEERRAMNSDYQPPEPNP